MADSPGRKKRVASLTDAPRHTPVKVGAIEAPGDPSTPPSHFEPPSPGADREIFARHALMPPAHAATSPSGAASSTGATSPPKAERSARLPDADEAKRATEKKRSTSFPSAVADELPKRRFSFPKMGTLFLRAPVAPRAPQPRPVATAAPPKPAGPATSPRVAAKRRAGGAACRNKAALMHPRDMTVGSPDDRVTLVLDLDETLVRSSFDSGFNADFVAPFALNGSWCTARVRKRPFVDDFLLRVSRHFELVVMTAGVEPYASLVLDTLDTRRLIEKRFYRDSCTKTPDGLLVKDLHRLRRDLARTVLVDNSPNAYLWHPRNAIDVSDFVGDGADSELPVIAAFLEKIKDCDDLRPHLPHWRRGGDYDPGPLRNAREDDDDDAEAAAEGAGDATVDGWSLSDLKIA
ncbi:HAD-like domain-containing protein [Pelagophyceae sp. CCMP2097]|nr:HAD-like domain-containing protein [Pelagophyceae sp. CCMP2097]